MLGQKIAGGGGVTAGTTDKSAANLVGMRVLFCVLCCALGASFGLTTTTTRVSRSPGPRAAVTAVARTSEKYGDAPPALSLSAPCKINLFLRILRKRDDGFHELASLFQTVSLADTLDFWVEDAADDEPLCSMEVSEDSIGRDGIPTDESNLVMRALQLYADKTGEKRYSSQPERAHTRVL